MIARTEIEWDPDFADISSGLDKNKNARMDNDRTDCAKNWLKQNQNDFLGGTGWCFPKRDGKEGGFGKIFVLSHHEYGKCVVKMVSLVQLLDLGHSETDDDKKLLERGKQFFESKLQKLKEITEDKKSRNLCRIDEYVFIPYGNGTTDDSSYKGTYSHVLSDYIICTKMEPLQEINYVRDFCDGAGVFDEQRLIDFAIKMCDSMMQLEGYYHRDLHPGNFMRSLDESREWKLIDYDSILEIGNNAPHLDFAYRVKCDGSSSAELSYKSPDVNGRYDIFDDVYSAGCVLYDIANYDYSIERFRPRRYTGTPEVLECDEISEELLQIIRKACSQYYSNRYKSWMGFRKALLGIRDTWRKRKHIRTIPGVCEEWICKKGSISARMRVVDAENHDLLKEYGNHYSIKKKVKFPQMHLPIAIHSQNLIEEYEKDGFHYFVEEQPMGVPLNDYIKSSCFDRNYYIFILQFLKSYVQLLSKVVRIGVLSRRKLSSYRNLITSNNIVVNNGELWINGFAIPEREYRYYFHNCIRHNGFIEYIDNEEYKECTAVYFLGVLLYELITGDTDDTEISNVRPESRIEISDEENGDLIDLTNAFRAAYDNNYTISDIRESIEKLYGV